LDEQEFSTSLTTLFHLRTLLCMPGLCLRPHRGVLRSLWQFSAAKTLQPFFTACFHFSLLSLPGQIESRLSGFGGLS
jgi:hypothetical protein